MFRPRVIPVILVNEIGHAVKTVSFKRPVDLGDSINTVSLFNAFQVDELVVLDISATPRGRVFPHQLMTDIASEAEMPLAIGGGISSLDDIYRLLHGGAEKVILSSAAIADPAFVKAAAAAFASSSITVCIDARRDWLGRYRVGSAKDRLLTPAAMAARMEEMGAGEIIIQSVDQDGRMGGYDVTLTSAVADAVTIPVIALGGAGRFAHIEEAHRLTHASAFASGSTFCFHNESRGVLISYPNSAELNALADKS